MKTRRMIISDVQEAMDSHKKCDEACAKLVKKFIFETQQAVKKWLLEHYGWEETL